VIQKHPIGSFVLPFLRALYHIRGWAIDFSPLGLAVTGVDVARSYIPTDLPGMQHSGLAAGIASGAALGGMVGGLPGAVIGGAAGAWLGKGANLAGGPYRESFSNPIPGPVARLELRLAANAIGTAGFYWLLGMALEGALSASGPPDDPIPLLDPAPPDFEASKLRKTMELQGWRRYSIKIGDTWYSYANWGPLAYLMASAAAIGESYRYGVPAEKKHATGTLGRLQELATQGDAGLTRTATRRFFGVVKNTSYLNGLIETVNLVDNLYELAGFRGSPEGETPSAKQKRERRLRQEIRDYAGDIATTFLPVSALANTMAGAQDPLMRATQYGDLSDAVAMRVPEQGPIPDLGPPGDFIPDVFGQDDLGSRTGRRQGLPSQVDVLGRPVPNEQTGFWGSINPIRSHREDLSSPTVNAMVDAGIGLPSAPSELIYRPLSGKTDAQGNIDPKSRQRDLKIVQITPRIQMELQETIGQRVDARVQELLNEVPEGTRKADPEGWRKRLSDETMAISKKTTREFTDNTVNALLVMEPLLKDSDRVRPFEPEAERDQDVGAQTEAKADESAPVDIGPPGGEVPAVKVPQMPTPSPTPKKSESTTRGPTPVPTPRAPAAPPADETPAERQRRLVRERNGLAP